MTRPASSLITLAAALADLPDVWRARAAELRAYAAEPQAVTLERVADELAAALTARAEAVLTLEQAATESGFSAEHLRKLVSAGTVPNAGRKGAPRIRRADLPRKPGAPTGQGSGASSVTPAAGGYDPNADALSLLRRRAG